MTGRTRTAVLSRLVSKDLLKVLRSSIFLINQVYPFCSFFTSESCQRSSLAAIVETQDRQPDKSSFSLYGISKSVMLNRGCVSHKSIDENFSDECSLKDLLLSVFDISPEIVRRFRRVLVLKPGDVLELLLQFDFYCGGNENELRKVKSLWRIFRWSEKQSEEFKHVERSYEVMARMLVRVELYSELDHLFKMMDREGIFMECHKIVSSLITGFVKLGDLERSVSTFDSMRKQGLVPSLLCYIDLLDLLVRKKEAELAFRICIDMEEMRFQLNNAEKGLIYRVCTLLCRVGKIREARGLVKSGMAFGLEPHGDVVNEIASGYCEKMDFEDALGFFFEIKRPPDILTCNKILFSICRNFGTERADTFLQDLEDLGFSPDERSYGILIGWSCLEEKLKNALLYLSETLSRGLKPDVCSYNALISALFRAGMWKNAREILLDMAERGITANLSTFKVLLAGYCLARQFDEAKLIVKEMGVEGLIQISSSEDPLAKAFSVLGLNPREIRVRRDNHVAFVMTEFFDSMGNGLYLETDQTEYEKILIEVLKDSMITDFSKHVIGKCDAGNLKGALVMVDHTISWGQELSLPALCLLLRGLCYSCYRIKDIPSLLDKFPRVANQLDQDTLNLLVQAFCKKGYTPNGLVILDEMLHRHLTINPATYSALIRNLCKTGNLKEIWSCWSLVSSKSRWLLEIEDFKALLPWLCQKEMVKETLKLFERMFMNYTHFRLDIYNLFLENLCATGYSSIAHLLVEKFQHCVLSQTAWDHLVRGYIKEKRYSEAFSLLEKMLSENLAPSLDVSILLIPQLIRANRIDRVACLKEICLREYPSEVHLVDCALISGLCKTKRVKEAVHVFEDLMSKHIVPDPEIVNVLLQGYCQFGELRRIYEFLGIMIRNHISFSIASYGKLVKLLCSYNRVLCALRLKELMLMGSNFSRLVISNILIFYLFVSGNYFYVKRVLCELQEYKLPPDAATYNFLIQGYSRVGDASSSLRYLSNMISEGFRPKPHCLTAVTSCLCQTGKFEKAMNVSEEMESRGWVHSSIVQYALAESLISNGKLQEAENFLNRLAKKNLIPDNISYDSLIKQFCSYGKLDKAIALLDLMLKKQNVPSSTSYDSIIHGLCESNKLDQAMDFHAEMLDMNLTPSTNTWQTIVQKFCSFGKTAEAEKVLTAMVQAGVTPTRKMYSSVVNRYQCERNLSKAAVLLKEMQHLGFNPDFETHWSVISNLSNSCQNDDRKASPSILSRLLSGSHSK